MSKPVDRTKVIVKCPLCGIDVFARGFSRAGNMCLNCVAKADGLKSINSSLETDLDRAVVGVNKQTYAALQIILNPEIAARFKELEEQLAEQREVNRGLVEALKNIHTAAQKGDGTLTECDVAYLSEDALKEWGGE